MTLSKTPERLALSAIVPLLLFAGAAFAAGKMVILTAPYIIAILALIGAAIAFFTTLHAGLRRLAAQEARDQEAAGTDQAALFNQDEEGVTEVRARNLRQYERIVLPTLTGIAAVVEGTLALWFFQLMASPGLQPQPGKALAAASLLGFCAVLIYIFGSYLAGLAYRGSEPVLKAVSAELVGGGYVGGLMALSLLLMPTDFAKTPIIVAHVIGALLAIRAIEKIANIVIDVYRPRSGGSLSLVHESRLFGFVAQPRSMLSGFRESIQYQFGIEITEQRLRQLGWATLPMILIQLAIIGLFTCLIVVNPGEQAVVERLGKPLASRPILEPGLHVKLPWPIDHVYRQPVKQLQQLQLGSKLAETATGTLLWLDDESVTDDLFLTPNSGTDNADSDAKRSSFNLLVSTTHLDYRISDLHAYLYRTAEPEALLRRVAIRELTNFFASHDQFDLQQIAWNQINADLLNRITKAVDQQQMGVEIVNLGLINLQPPTPTVPAFQAVIAATEEMEQARLSALAEAEEIATMAIQMEGSILSEARNYQGSRIKLSDAEVQVLRLRQEFYAKYPEMFRQWAYLDTVQRVLKDKRKIVIATDPDSTVINLDLKDKASTEIFNFGQ